MIRVGQCSAGPGTQPRAGGRQLRSELLWDEQSLLSAALVGVRVRLACQHTPACVGGDPGQGAREIWEPPSEERALWKAKPLSLPREQEFFKGCNYRAAEREQPADPTLPGRRPGLEPRRAPRRVPSCLDASGVPQGHPAAFRVTPGAAEVALATFMPTRHESAGFGVAPVQNFCLMAIFLPTLFPFKCEVSPARTPAS